MAPKPNQAATAKPVASNKAKETTKVTAATDLKVNEKNDTITEAKVESFVLSPDQEKDTSDAFKQ